MYRLWPGLNLVQLDHHLISRKTFLIRNETFHQQTELQRLGQTRIVAHCVATVWKTPLQKKKGKWIISGGCFFNTIKPSLHVFHTLSICPSVVSICQWKRHINTNSKHIAYVVEFLFTKWVQREASHLFMTVPAVYCGHLPCTNCKRQLCRE